jgi:hypothetical protein
MSLKSEEDVVKELKDHLGLLKVKASRRICPNEEGDLNPTESLEKQVYFDRELDNKRILIDKAKAADKTKKLNLASGTIIAGIFSKRKKTDMDPGEEHRRSYRVCRRDAVLWGNS